MSKCTHLFQRRSGCDALISHKTKKTTLHQHISWRPYLPNLAAWVGEPVEVTVISVISPWFDLFHLLLTLRGNQSDHSASPQFSVRQKQTSGLFSYYLIKINLLYKNGRVGPLKQIHPAAKHTVVFNLCDMFLFFFGWCRSFLYTLETNEGAVNLPLYPLFVCKVNLTCSSITCLWFRFKCKAKLHCGVHAKKSSGFSISRYPVSEFNWNWRGSGSARL